METAGRLGRSTSSLSTLVGLDRIWYNKAMATRRTVGPVNRPLEFIGSSKDDLSSFPLEVKFVTGYDCAKSSEAKSHPDAKRMKGSLRDVIEISVSDDSGDRTFRTTLRRRLVTSFTSCTLSRKKRSPVLRPRSKIFNLIERRLKAAEEHYEEHYAKNQ